MRRLRPTAGTTLIEVLIAVTLLSLLTLGILMVLRVGLLAYSKTTDRLMDNRRVTGAQRVLQDQLMGLMPVTPPCAGKLDLINVHFNFLEAEPQRLRMVSAFSLQEGWRGRPQILEFLVIPGREAGVRLVVNEIPYSPMTAGKACVGTAPQPGLGITVPVFTPTEVGPRSFVLADQLAACQFSYLTGTGQPNDPILWRPSGTGRGWPHAIRIQMAPLKPDPARLEPVTITAPLYLYRTLNQTYEDN